MAAVGLRERRSGSSCFALGAGAGGSGVGGAGGGSAGRPRGRRLSSQCPQRPAEGEATGGVERKGSAVPPVEEVIPDGGVDPRLKAPVGGWALLPRQD